MHGDPFITFTVIGNIDKQTDRQRIPKALTSGGEFFTQVNMEPSNRKSMNGVLTVSVQNRNSGIEGPCW